MIADINVIYAIMISAVTLIIPSLMTDSIMTAMISDINNEIEETK